MDIGITKVKKIIGQLCNIIIENEIYFCELDSAAGDGDFGISLAKGFREIKNQMDDIDMSNITSFLKGCSLIITEYCGGASGPIWGSAFRSAAISAKGKEKLGLNDIAELFMAAVAGIQKRGGAKLGDKTLLDALIPVSDTLKKAAQTGTSIKEAIKLASISATQGAKNTKKLIALKGRASYVGERSLNFPDAGAMAISVIFNSFLDINQ